MLTLTFVHSLISAYYLVSSYVWLISYSFVSSSKWLGTLGSSSFAFLNFYGFLTLSSINKDNLSHILKMIKASMAA
jgi:hypothetical protein